MTEQTHTPPIHPHHKSDEHLTMTEAAKIAPGRPSTNCIWRWCRRGVLARTGERVRLQHVRIGGKIFTMARWLDEFGSHLAEADAVHFSLSEDDSCPPPSRPSRRNAHRERFDQHRRESIEHADQELRNAGL